MNNLNTLFPFIPANACQLYRAFTNNSFFDSPYSFNTQDVF